MREPEKEHTCPTESSRPVAEQTRLRHRMDRKDRRPALCTPRCAGCDTCRPPASAFRRCAVRESSGTQHLPADADRNLIDMLFTNSPRGLHRNFTNDFFGHHSANLHWHLALDALGHLAARGDGNLANLLFGDHAADLDRHFADLFFGHHAVHLHRHLANLLLGTKLVCGTCCVT